MNRRSFLYGVGSASVVSVSGCLGQIPAASGSGTSQREVSIHDQDSTPADSHVSIDVELLEERTTDSQPVQLQIHITNEGSERAFSVGDGSCSLFNRSKGGSDTPEGLWLYSPGHADRIERDEGKWTEDRSADEYRGFSNQGCPPRPFEPDESLTTQYELWDDYRVGGYFETGTYRWEQQVSVWNDPDTKSSSTAADLLFDWGFEIAVAEP